MKFLPNALVKESIMAASFRNALHSTTFLFYLVKFSAQGMTEISMYLYADNMQRGTWKFPCIFLVNVQTNTEIHAKRRQKIMNKAFFNF